LPLGTLPRNPILRVQEAGRPARAAIWSAAESQSIESVPNCQGNDAQQKRAWANARALRGAAKAPAIGMIAAAGAAVTRIGLITG
jgi:hypothetical protein